MFKFPRLLLYTLCTWMVLVVFLHLDDMSLEVYDEARLAVSAVEMMEPGSNWLVATYNGKPDHWGTKPTLLLLCQTFWVNLLGVGELAVRLPSALSALTLCALLIWWGKRDWGGMLVGAIAGLFLLCNWQFMGNHGPRTADYEAMLSLFLTAQVVFFYRWVTDGTIRWLWLAGAAVLLAGLTKGVAGGFFLPGIGLWMLLTRAGRKLLLRPSLYGIIGGAILLVVGYYLLRNAVDPLFIEMVWHNELGGRFVKHSQHDYQPWWFYLNSLATDRTSAQLLFLLLPPLICFLWPKRAKSGDRTVAVEQGRQTPALLVLVTLVVFLAVISAAGTRLYWYKTPALPLLGILIGGFLYRVAQLVADGVGGLRGRWVAVGLLSALFILPMVCITDRILHPREHQETPRRKLGYRSFMRRSAVRPPYTVLIRDYNPNARFYVYQMQSRGLDVELKRIRALLPPLVYDARPPGGLTVGERVIVCNNDTWNYVAERFNVGEIYKYKSCKLVELMKEKPTGK